MKKRNMGPFPRLIRQRQSVRWIVMAASLALFAAACEDAAIPTPMTTATVTPDTSPQIQATTTTRTPAASADLISLVTEAAAAACGDGILTRQDLEGYKTRLRDLGVDPGSALSRTAAIVECGLTTEEALDRLP